MYEDDDDDDSDNANIVGSVFFIFFSLFNDFFFIFCSKALVILLPFECFPLPRGGAGSEAPQLLPISLSPSDPDSATTTTVAA